MMLRWISLVPAPIVRATLDMYIWQNPPSSFA